MLFDIFLVILLVFLNGFFVAAEFAIVKVRESQLEIKAQSGSPTAKLSLDILKNLNAYLSATQLGITLASLGLGWVGEEAASKVVTQILQMIGVDASTDLSHTIAISVSFFLITVMHIVFGEQVPKTLAITSPEKGAYLTAWPLTVFYKIFKPLIWALNSSSIFVLKLFGITADSKEEEHSTEEIKMLIEKGMETGAIHTSDHELIENVFHFTELNVKQIMIPRTKMVALEVSSSDQKIMEIIHQEGYSRLPVYKNTIDDVVGIINTKDILKMISQGGTIVLSNHLKPAYFIPETKKINDLLKDFQRKRLHMAVVVDEFGGTAGIVTLEDVLEELVGEIQDEDDEEKPIVEKVSEKEYIISGLASILDVNEHLRYPLPEGDDFETVSGLMNYIFDKIPEQNDIKESNGYRFTILKTNQKIVEQVKLEEILKEDD